MCPKDGCIKDFLRSSHLQHHIKSAHSDVREYLCQYEGCGKGFITRTRLKRHHASHEGREKFTCTANGCGQTFRKHNTLQKHIIAVHEGRKPFVCHVLNSEGRSCGAGFETASNLRIHEGTVHSGRIYSCTVCDGKIPIDIGAMAYAHTRVTFSTLSALQAHIRIDHPPTCQECGSTSKSSSELAIHIETHHTLMNVDQRRKHLCPEPGCGRSFTQKNNLVTHMNNFHLEHKTFVCGDIDLSTLSRIEGWDGSNACGQAMSTKGNLVEHIRTVHLGLQQSRKGRRKQMAANAKAFANQAYPSSMELLTGAGYVTGRDLECLISDCEYRFQRDYDLQRHLESHHRLAKPDMQLPRAGADPSLVRWRLDGSYYIANTAESDADGALSQQFADDCGSKDYFELLEEAAATGGAFWLGGEQQTDTDSMALPGWDSVGMDDVNMNQVCQDNEMLTLQ